VSSFNGSVSAVRRSDPRGRKSVNSSDVATGVARAPQLATASAAHRRSADNRLVFGGVLAVLLTVGWAANHFAALIPVISEREHLSAAMLNAIFGIYALGLLPGLLIGGRASDALGRQSVALVGSATALAGTVAMLLSQHSTVLLAGRVIVGLGAGLAISACTAWASDLKGPAGAAVAGAVLTAGFAIGPFAAGLIATAVAPGIRESFGIAAGIVVVAAVAALVAARRATVNTTSTVRREPEPALPVRQASLNALSWALPMAPWVFASVTLAFVTIPTRVHMGLAAPMVAGIAALIANGSSGSIQIIARLRGWGPRVGTVGALLAALCYAVAAAAPSEMPLALGLSLVVVLGCAAGLLLREGLIDLEAAAPQRVRGALTGVFYTATYIGFGLPLLLGTIGSAGSAVVLAVMAVLALATAANRAVRLRRNDHRQN
jgi:MFS family permease